MFRLGKTDALCDAWTANGSGIIALNSIVVLSGIMEKKIFLSSFIVSMLNILLDPNDLTFFYPACSSLLNLHTKEE